MGEIRDALAKGVLHLIRSQSQIIKNRNLQRKNISKKKSRLETLNFCEQAQTEILEECRKKIAMTHTKFSEQLQSIHNIKLSRNELLV